MLSSLIPGTLLLCWIPLCFPAILSLQAPKYPEAFGVIVLTALAVFVGQLIQALASLIEPLLQWTWGGCASEKALTTGLPTRYLPQDSAARIRQKLESAVGEGTSAQSLFHYAIQLSDAAGIGRAPRFNSLYAYHRGLFTLMLIVLLTFLASTGWGMARNWPLGSTIPVIVGMLLILWLVWHRTKQRDCYYVREVLFTAERVLDEKLITAKPADSAAEGG